jgi:hypothetical protein
MWAETSLALNRRYLPTLARQVPTLHALVHPTPWNLQHGGGLPRVWLTRLLGADQAAWAV